MILKSSPRGWHSRGYLPHFDGGSIPQSVTFRLADSLPKERLEGFENELACLPEDKATARRRELIEAYLDLGSGHAWLRDPRLGQMVENALLYFDGARYLLHSWVIMPNHVHALLTPAESFSLTQILHSWKSFTAKVANRVLGQSGRFWQEDYFDRYMRDDRHYFAAIEYIELNPVGAGLCERKEDWKFGSARRREETEEIRNEL